MTDRPRGRRSGENTSREEIQTAARRLFALHGFDRVSLRQVAKEADVDPSLVGHFFGTKQELFVAVTDLPFDPTLAIDHALKGDREEVGLRLAQFALQSLDNEHIRITMISLIRAAAAEPFAAAQLRELLERQVLAVVAKRLAVDNAELRAALVMTQMVGLLMARHVISVEALAETDRDELIKAIAPTIQRYLMGDIAS